MGLNTIKQKKYVYRTETQAKLQIIYTNSGLKLYLWSFILIISTSVELKIPIKGPSN